MLKSFVAVSAGKAARFASRLRGGGGSALPGLVVERIDPTFLTHAMAKLPDGVVVVSGTNGKTTTTKMLVALLRAHGKSVFTNPTGSNFTRGVISAMLEQLPANGRLQADMAVVELDEAHSLNFAKAVRPTHALLLNVARDQLDRFAEIDHTAGLLSRLAEQVSTGLVLNRDDSFISRIADVVRGVGGTGTMDHPAPVISYFGVHPSIAHRLPELQEQDVRFEEAATVPDVTEADALLRPIDERSFEILFGNDAGHVEGTGARADGQTGSNPSRVGPLELRQRGLAAMINATAATAMARQLLGTAFDEVVAARALAAVTPPFGRGEIIDADGQPLELVLVKNPAGFTVALSTYGATPVRTMIAINDNIADGRDVSWLYDVSFESLREKGVALTTGLRAYDMALRLRYDGVETAEVDQDLERALTHFLRTYPDEPKRIFCTYTAMMTLRRNLAARYGLAGFGEDPTG